MTANGWIRKAAALGLVMLSGTRFDSVAEGQIAYQPIVSPILNGVALTATPVVSADRRYVRMSLSPYFNTVNGFTTYSAPIAAVGGGNFAGMGGVIAGGVGQGGAMGPMTGYGETGTYLAGDFPPAATAGFGFGTAADPFDQAGALPMRAAAPNRDQAGRAMAGDPGMFDPIAFSDVPQGRSVRPGSTNASARRQAARKAASRRSAKTARRHR